jgi:hypothetical protein
VGEDAEGKKVSSAKKTWRELYKPILDHLFASARSSGTFLTPDGAMAALKEDLATEFPSRKGAEPTKGLTVRTYLRPRMDLVAGLREAHRYAVDLFYRTYFPRKGAPRTADQDLATMLSLREQGKNYRSIALFFGLPYPESKDMIRKRIESARQRRAKKGG